MPLDLTPAQIAAANAESVTTFFLYEIYYDPTHPTYCLRTSKGGNYGYPEIP